MANPFDQFDTQADANPFDQFDSAAPVAAAQQQSIPSPTLSQEVGPPQPVTSPAPEQPWYAKAYGFLRNNSGGLADEGKIAFPTTAGQVRPESQALNAQIDAALANPNRFGKGNIFDNFNNAENAFSAHLGLPPLPPPRPPSGPLERGAHAIGDLPYDIANFVATPSGLATVAGYESGIPEVKLALSLGFGMDNVRQMMGNGTLEENVKQAMMLALMGKGAGEEGRAAIDKAKAPAPVAGRAGVGPGAEPELGLHPPSEPYVSPETGFVFPPRNATIPTPDVQTTQVARSPDSTTPGEVALGQQQAQVPEPASMGRSEAQGLGAGERPASLSNAYTESAREERGLPDMEQAARQDWGEAFDKAQAQIAARPNYGTNLVERLSKGAPKAINDVEGAAVDAQLIQAENGFDEALKNANDNPGPDAQSALDAAREQLQKTYTAAENAGTGTARGLNFRKAMAARDWSQPRMEAQARAELGGKPLDPELQAAIQDAYRRITAANDVINAPETAYSGPTPKDAQDLMDVAAHSGLTPEPTDKDIFKIQRQTARYQAKTEAQDTSPMRPPTTPLMNADKSRALYEREKAKADYWQMIREKQYAEKPAVIRGAIQVANLPRGVAVGGHAIVFPVSHAGDLLLRPASWNVAAKGIARTYAAAVSPEFHANTMGRMMATKFKDGSSAYELAAASKVDLGTGIKGSGLVKGSGISARAWDALKVMRFDLWKKEMEYYLKRNPGLSYADKLDLGKNLASWANHATGSGKGIIADSRVGQILAFGPKLTQSKINRMSVDPAKTVATVANWNKATLGERAAAKTRISGATQYATTLGAFLLANGAILKSLGSKQQINMSDPNKSDFWAFKVAGTDIAIPGLHSEMRFLAKVLAASQSNQKPQDQIRSAVADYGTSKLSPNIGLGLDALTSHDYRGRPLPWSNEAFGASKYSTPAKFVPDKFLPRYGGLEYALTKAPIPTTGISRYVYDQMREKGMKPTDAAQTVQALTIFGLGVPGFHVSEDYSLNAKPKR